MKADQVAFQSVVYWLMTLTDTLKPDNEMIMSIVVEYRGGFRLNDDLPGKFLYDMAHGSAIDVCSFTCELLDYAAFHSDTFQVHTCNFEQGRRFILRLGRRF